MAANRRLKQERELRGWSQAKLAEQLGTDATTVSRWERGLFFPTPYFRERLCGLFDKNAEQLGLLETTDQPSEPDLIHHRIGGQAGADGTRGEEPRSSALPLPPEVRRQGEPAFYGRDSAAPTIETTLSVLPADLEQQGDDLLTGMAVSPVPSWPKRGDTFTYILSSAAHDRHAHMLWEDAYVRTLRGQREEAQELGEASLQAFAHVGHPNASAIREWLAQRGLVSLKQPPTNGSSSSPHTPHSGDRQRSTNRQAAGSVGADGTGGEEPKRGRRRASRRTISIVGASLAVLLIVASTLILSGHAFTQSQLSLLGLPSLSSFATLHPTQAKSPSVAPAATSAAFPSTIQPHTTTPTVPPARPTPITTTSAKSAATPATPSAKPTPTSSTLTSQVTPESLTSSSCFLEPLGYRCTLTLSLFTSTQGTFTWHVSSTNIAAQFNATTGTGQTGQPVQLIVYLAKSEQGQKGQLVFSFTSSATSCTSSVSWLG